MNKELKYAIRNNIQELERLIRVAGYNDIGDRLRSISESEDQCSSLYEVFSGNLKKRRARRIQTLDRQLWFQQYKSPDGKSLSDEQVRSLTCITARWELGADETRDLKICLLLWRATPHLFCDGKVADSNVIRRCYDDLERMRDVDPTRRKVLLMTLSNAVEKEQKRLNKEEGKPTRSSKAHKMDTENSCRNPVLLTSALRSLTRKLWPNLGERELLRRRRSLSDNSLSGWKWRQLKYPEIVLSLHNSAARRFERHKWKSIEFQAINAYLERLPQFSIRENLRITWDSIARYYRGQASPPQVPPVDSSHLDNGLASLEIQTSASRDIFLRDQNFPIVNSPIPQNQAEPDLSNHPPGEVSHDQAAQASGRSDDHPVRYYHNSLASTDQASTLGLPQLARDAEDGSAAPVLNQPIFPETLSGMTQLATNQSHDTLPGYDRFTDILPSNQFVPCEHIHGNAYRYENSVDFLPSDPLVAPNFLSFLPVEPLNFHVPNTQWPPHM